MSSLDSFQETIKTELLCYLESLSLDELKLTSRKQCRLILEKKFNRNLLGYKRYIKSLLVGHVIVVKQRYITQQQPPTHPTETDTKLKQENTQRAEDMSANACINHEPKTSHSTAQATVQVPPNTKSCRKRKSYESDHKDSHSPPLKRPKISAENRDTTDSKDEHELETLLQHHKDRLHELEVQHHQSSTELLEAKQKNIQQKNDIYCEQILAGNHTSNEQVMQMTKTHQKKLDEIDKKYKKKICKLLKQHTTDRTQLHTELCKQICHTNGDIKVETISESSVTKATKPRKKSKKKTKKNKDVRKKKKNTKA